MLTTPCSVQDLGYLCLGNLVRVHTTHTDTILMNMKHYSCGIFGSFPEDPDKDLNDELHGRVVIIE